MGYMFRLLLSHLQALKDYRSNFSSQVHCGSHSALDYLEKLDL